MQFEQSDTPVISVDVKRYRVRIYLSTLHLLGDPRFIQLLYNACDGIIGIQGYQEKPKHQWHKVKYEKLTSKTPFEVYSKYLIDMLEKSLPVDDTDTIVRINGTLHEKQRLSIHKLSDAWITREEEENTNE